MKRYLLFVIFIAATIAAHAQLVEDFSPNPTGWILDQGAKFYNLNGNDVVQTPGAGDNTPSIICTPTVNKTSNTVKVCLDIWGYTPTMNAQIPFPCTPTYMDVVFVKSTVVTWQDAKDPANVLASIPNYTLPQNGGNMCVTFTFPTNVTDNNFKVILSFHADCNKGGYKYIIDNVSISGVALICGGTNCQPIALNDMFNRANSNELSFSGALYGSNLSYPSNPTVDPTGTDNDQNDGYADLQWKVLTAPPVALGSVTVNTDGTFSVTRTSNSITQLTFTYQLTDDGPDNDFTTTGDNMTSNATVTINWVAGGSLPVTLVNFNACRSGSTVSLTWTTNIESSNAGFNIQRSNGNGAFETVGFVAS